ncbi:MAG: substrate-binding domain-containing protein [Bradyrhizobium sp.]
MSASRLQNAWIAVAAGLALWLATGVAARAEVLRTGGTGAVYQTLRRLGSAFMKIEPGISIEIVEGLGSSGGIAATADGAIDFSISGRPLRAAEENLLKASVFARTPYGLATTHPNPGDVRSVEIADMYGSATSVWPDGTPVRLVLRPRSDSDADLLVSSFPNMHAAVEKARLRTEIPVAPTDQDNAAVAEKLGGALTAMTLAQLQTENLQMRFLSIDGVGPTLENFESGRYPYGKTFYLVVRSRTTPALDRLLGFLNSVEGEKVLRANGSLPVRP